MGLTFSKRAPPQPSPTSASGTTSTSTTSNSNTISGNGSSKAAASAPSNASNAGSNVSVVCDPQTNADSQVSSANNNDSASTDAANGTSKLGPEDKYKQFDSVRFLDEESLPYLLELRPHMHTLFCERKQRVCTAVGKLQELEFINIVRNPAAISSPKRRKSLTEKALFQESLVLQTAPKGVWIRIYVDIDTEAGGEVGPRRGRAVHSAVATCVSASGEESEWTFHYSVIEGSENNLSYHLSAEDVGCFISYRLESDSESIRANGVPISEVGETSDSKTESNTDKKDAEAPEDAPSEEEKDASLAKRGITSLFGSIPGDSNENEDKASINNNNNSNTDKRVRYTILRPLGVIVPGPPRLLDLEVEVIDAENGGTQEGEGEGVSSVLTIPRSKPLETIVAGNRLIARGKYIGGSEGSSEYWWLRVTDRGERSEVKAARAVSASDNFGDDDPRVLLIRQDDLNCEFKVKCRPARDDGAKGEIFTSKPTPPVRAAIVNFG